MFVDSGKSDSRHTTLDAIVGHCREWQPGQRPLLIFPEGTMTNGHEVVDFKKGAFVAGLPVRPTIVVYTGHFDPANTTYKMTDRGPRKVGPVEWARQFWGHYIHSVHVRVLPPYFPSPEEKAYPQIYAKNCQELMASELQRVRSELYKRSWQQSAGRTGGGMDYQCGDEVGTASRYLSSFFASLGCFGREC